MNTDQNLIDFERNLTLLSNEYQNIFLTLNGHYATADTLEPNAYHTETASGVYELMFNRQEQEKERGAASVAILTFNMKSNKIYVDTFDLNNPPSGEDSTPLTSPSYQFVLYLIPVRLNIPPTIGPSPPNSRRLNPL